MTNNQTTRALVVDDESDILELISLTLLRMGIDSICCSTLKEAKQQLSQQEYDFCLTDLRLPDGNGLELVQLIQKKQPQLPCAVITAHGSMDVAISAMKAGAFDFVSKPIELAKLRDLVQNAISLEDDNTDNEEIDTQHQLLIGKSQPIEKVRHAIHKLAKSMAPVFIQGQSGTGKELVARMIHHSGPRRNGPFIAVNCGAIPSELMESEFFGHLKGSFTGATSDKQGLFAAANGGTLFLDEVADLPLNMQVKLLRTLQEKSTRAVGSEKEAKIDVRILTATHKDLEKQVEKGDFRQDLFYRINVINLIVPPLHERPEDIALIADHILKKLIELYQIPDLKLSDEAKQALLRYDFPGNVRELENILERAVAMAENQEIKEADLELPNSDSCSLSGKPSLAHLAGRSLDEYLAAIEEELVEQALAKTQGNKTKAAEELGISFRAMRYKVKKLEEG